MKTLRSLFGNLGKGKEEEPVLGSSRDLPLQSPHDSDPSATSVDMPPIVGLVNGTLHQLRTTLQRESNTSWGNTPQRAEAAKVLEGIQYDGRETNAASLRTRLTPLAEQKTGLPIERVVKDLEYIGDIEIGGLPLVNQRMKQLFETARKEETPLNERKQAMQDINDLLGRAIYTFPHLATGVEVTLELGAEQRENSFEEEFGYSFNRRPYNFLLETAREKGEVLPEDKVVTPLPYGFTTGTHGSGERAAMGQSWQDVFLTTIHPPNDYLKEVPVVALGIEVPLLTPYYAHFMLNEVKGVQFTDSGKKGEGFTPWVDNRKGKYTLISKGNYVSDYLYFRNFINHAAFRDRNSLPDVTEEEWQRAQKNLLEPKDMGNLLRSDFKRDTMDFFAAEWASKAEDVKLYEFTGVRKGLTDNNETVRILARAKRGDKKTLSKTKIYQGHEVVRRLAAIPVEERDF